MRIAEPFPLDTLDACFRLLTTGPAPLALDGRRLGHGAPARRIPLGELRTMLQHPAATDDLRRAVFHELARLAVQDRYAWTLGLAGVLLPGLRKLAAASTMHPLVAEADVLDRFHNLLDQPACEVAEFALTVLRFTQGALAVEKW
ncbi:MAG TPA: hypothetical protein VE776_08005 [Actinomycetota bacterium]|jgi:hypothetical protein|nr:hypothetical protein [Actinomycetota bacterium]